LFHPAHTNGLIFAFVDEKTAAQPEKEFPLEGSLHCSLVPYLTPDEISQHLTTMCLFRQKGEVRTSVSIQGEQKYDVTQSNLGDR
jgi:hypothetical protein